jgi:hypothetical protein
MKTVNVPPEYIVRFDYLRHPQVTTAVLINRRTRNVVSVGVAKFNPKDGTPNIRAGENIALHRALRALEAPRKMHTALTSFVVPAEAKQVFPASIDAESIADELVR